MPDGPTALPRRTKSTHRGEIVVIQRAPKPKPREKIVVRKPRKEKGKEGKERKPREPSRPPGWKPEKPMAAWASLGSF